MKIQKKFDMVSFSEIILYSLSVFILLNGICYLIFTLIFKTPFIELFGILWIGLIFYPVVIGIVVPFANRNATLTIESQDKSQIVWDKIAELLKHKEYQEIERTKDSLVFDFLKRGKRFMYLNKGRVKMSNNENSINVTGNRNILYQIECKVKYDNDINIS